MKEKEKSAAASYVSGLGYLPQTPRLAERRALSLHYYVVVLSCMLCVGLDLLLAEPCVRLAAALGGSETVQAMTTQGVRLLAAGLPAIALLWAGEPVRETAKLLRFSRAPGYRYGYAILMALGLSALGVVLSRLLLAAVESVSPLYLDLSAPALPSNVGELALEVLVVVLLPAFLEETLFRGLILGKLLRYGNFTAVFVSSVLFALLAPRFDEVAPRLFLGLALGLFRLRSFSLLVPMAASAAVKLSRLAIGWVPSLPATAGTLLLLLAGMAGAAFWAERHKRAFQTRDRDTHLTNRKKILQFFANFCFWILALVQAARLLGEFQLVG